MDKEQKRYYTSVVEKIFSMPKSEREQCLANIKKQDREFYERIEHLADFLTIQGDELESYAKYRIRKILSDLDTGL